MLIGFGQQLEVTLGTEPRYKGQMHEAMSYMGIEVVCTGHLDKVATL